MLTFSLDLRYEKDFNDTLMCHCYLLIGLAKIKGLAL